MCERVFFQRFLSLELIFLCQRRTLNIVETLPKMDESGIELPDAVGGAAARRATRP